MNTNNVWAKLEDLEDFWRIIVKRLFLQAHFRPYEDFRNAANEKEESLGGPEDDSA